MLVPEGYPQTVSPVSKNGPGRVNVSTGGGFDTAYQSAVSPAVAHAVVEVALEWVMPASGKASGTALKPLPLTRLTAGNKSVAAVADSTLVGRTTIWAAAGDQSPIHPAPRCDQQRKCLRSGGIGHDYETHPRSRVDFGESEKRKIDTCI